MLMRLIGARDSGGILVSYLLSESKYTRALIELGYQDALQRREEIMSFIDIKRRHDADMPQ